VEWRANGDFKIRGRLSQAMASGDRGTGLGGTSQDADHSAFPGGDDVCPSAPKHTGYRQSPLHTSGSLRDCLGPHETALQSQKARKHDR
jgi:hypothetical protein